MDANSNPGTPLGDDAAKKNSKAVAQKAAQSRAFYDPLSKLSFHILFVLMVIHLALLIFVVGSSLVVVGFWSDWLQMPGESAPSYSW